MSTDTAPSLDQTQRTSTDEGHGTRTRRGATGAWRHAHDRKTEQWRGNRRRRLRNHLGISFREADAIANQAVSYRRLVLYLEQLHRDDPKAWFALRHELKEADAFLVALEARCAGEPAAEPGKDPLDLA